MIPEILLVVFPREGQPENVVAGTSLNDVAWARYFWILVAGRQVCVLICTRRETPNQPHCFSLDSSSRLPKPASKVARLEFPDELLADIDVPRIVSVKVGASGNPTDNWSADFINMLDPDADRARQQHWRRSYFPFADLNGSGSIAVNDVVPVRDHLGHRLPVNEPFLQAAALPIVAGAIDKRNADAVMELLRDEKRRSPFHATDEDLIDDLFNDDETKKRREWSVND